MSPVAYVIGAVIAALAGIVGTKLTSRSQKESAQIEARGPEWQAYVVELKAWTTAQLAERDKAIEELKKQVTTLAAKEEKWKKRYYSAIHYIRELLLVLPEADRPVVPDSLRNEFL